MTQTPDGIPADAIGDKSLDEVVELLRGERVAMLASHDGDLLVSRPMAVMEVDDDHVLWSIIKATSDKTDQIAADNRVNLSFAGDNYLSVSGTAEIVHDEAKLKELWNPHVTAWMQCEPTDPEAALLKVTPHTIGYWETPSAPGYLMQVVKGLLGDHKPEGGDSGVVQA